MKNSMARGMLLARDCVINRFEIDRLLEEAKLLGVILDQYDYEKLDLSLDDQNLHITNKGKLVQISNYSWCITTASSWNSTGAPELKSVLIDFFIRNSIRVLNGVTLLQYPKLSKLRQHYLFFMHQIPVIATNYSMQFPPSSCGLGYPVIIKGVYGSRGERVFKADNREELAVLRKSQRRNEWLVQSRLMTGSDLRVIVLGNKVLGAMKRIAVKGSHLSNYSQGGRVKNYVLDPGLNKLCLRISRLFELDYVGIDIMFDENDKPYVLEVNRHAQFQGFEKATGINVAREILEYLIEKP